MNLNHACIPISPHSQIFAQLYDNYKYRVKNCDKARIASDTRKGLDQLEKMRYNEPESFTPPLDEGEYFAINEGLGARSKWS